MTVASALYCSSDPIPVARCMPAVSGHTMTSAAKRCNLLHLPHLYRMSVYTVLGELHRTICDVSCRQLQKSTQAELAPPDGAAATGIDHALSADLVDAQVKSAALQRYVCLLACWQLHAILHDSGVYAGVTSTWAARAVSQAGYPRARCNGWLNSMASQALHVCYMTS